MSTRGALGFRIHGTDKISYNHYDSYPAGLGETTLAFLKTALKDEKRLRERVDALRVVQEDEKPTFEDVQRLRPYTDLRISNQSVTDWYCLLRETQGDLEKILKAGVIADYKEFLSDSIFCEWAYIINLDTRVFEVYQGFQEKPHAAGRYARLHVPGPGEKDTYGYPVHKSYYPVALIAEFDFDSLPHLLVPVLHQAGVEV